MTKLRLLTIMFAAMVFTSAAAEKSHAVYPLAARRSSYRATQYNWHGNYAHTSYGQPVALVVAPTVNLQTNYSWGVGSSRLSHLDHQFGRSYPGPNAGGRGFWQTPNWPSDTTQFGVYYVRGPW